MNHQAKSQASEGAYIQAHVVDPAVQKLEALPQGACLTTWDGGRYIRTDRVCICFCNLVTGATCSAKDICYRHGGIKEECVHH